MRVSRSVIGVPPPRVMPARGEIGDLRPGEQCHHHVHLPVRLPGDVHPVPVHHAGADLGADVGGQAVHVQRVAVGGRAPFVVRRRSSRCARRCVRAPAARWRRSSSVSPAALAATRSTIRSWAPQLFGYTTSAPANASSMSSTTRNDPPSAGVVGGGRHRRVGQLVAGRMSERHVGADAGQQRDQPLRRPTAAWRTTASRPS